VKRAVAFATLTTATALAMLLAFSEAPAQQPPRGNPPRGGAPARPAPPRRPPGKPTPGDAAAPAPTAEATSTAATAAPTPTAKDTSDAGVVEVRKFDGGAQVIKFGELEIEGRLKSPQLVYFLRRVRAEFAAGDLGHRSFLRELSDTRKDQSF